MRRRIARQPCKYGSLGNLAPPYSPIAHSAVELESMASMEPKSLLTGIGGLLLLLIVRLWIGALIRLLSGMATPNHAVGFVNIFFAAMGGAAAFMLGARSPKGLKLTKVFLLAEAVYFALELLLPASGSDPAKPVGYLVASIAWFVYLLRSKRVQNTYFGAEFRASNAPFQAERSS